MAEDMSVEQPRPTPKEGQIAERWMRIKGVHKPEEPKTGGLFGRVTEAFRRPAEVSAASSSQMTGEAYDLFVEKQALQDDIARKQREVMEPKAPALTLDQKKELVKQGKIGAILQSITTSEPFGEVVAKSQTRTREIDTRLDQIFSTPGMYEKFHEDLSRQVRIRHQAREVRSLDKFTEQTDVLAVKLTREAQVQGRTLTSAERQFIDDNQALKKDAVLRRQDLLKDPEVFDRVRIMDLQEYRHQQERRNGRFAVTPSRQVYIKKLEEWWANNQHVLLTGATGTGKTELVRYAAEKLFRKLPFKIPGDPDMNIYRLLGATGLKVEKDSGSDVPRYSELLLAMGVEGGNGGPVLYDEMDASPNKANLSLKELLNRVPGQKVREDVGHKAFTVGKDYCLAATANVLGEKHPDRYPIGDEVIRIFRPLEVDYMPVHEVYDLALASLMDRRGGIPLSESDARTVLKNLCDAASWIQDAYQGRQVVTDPSSGTVLEARGQAATGKAASLKKALLDPGRTLDMLNGWSAAQVKGVSFEDYLNQRVTEFINNRAYPDEDRYYLTEIFALKGFLRGKKAGELMVAGLTQDTLDRWSGATSQREVKAGAQAYLTADRVAKLDPYRRFKRPVSADAEDLLAEDEETQTTESARSVTSEKVRQVQSLIGDITSMDTGKSAHVAYLNKLEEIGKRSTSVDERKQVIVLLDDYAQRGAFRGASHLSGEVDRWDPLTSIALEKAGQVRIVGINGSTDLGVIKDYAGDIAKSASKATHATYINKVFQVGSAATSSDIARRAVELLEDYAKRGVYREASNMSGEVDRWNPLTQQAAQKASELRAKILASL